MAGPAPRKGSTAQRETLRALGCQYVQGFLFAPPLQPDRVDALLAMR